MWAWLDWNDSIERGLQNMVAPWQGIINIDILLNT